MACVQPRNEIEVDLPALQAIYRRERDRRIRPDGEGQFLEVSNGFAGFGETDPYSPPIERAAISQDIDVAILGGGFAGMMSAAHLKQEGVENFRIIELAGDFGGTWYWNRYPGAQCDIDSYCYMPLLEETGYMPTQKYAFSPELFEHCKRIGRHFGLYDKALFGTLTRSLRWDEAIKSWHVETNRGDDIRARFLIMAAGSFNRPKLPGIPGIMDYKGHAFHTSRWDYAYTGGKDTNQLTKLADKRVAIIGTGATAVQCIPHLGRHAGHLYVIQRTPSAVDARNNRPTDPEWVKTLKPGWQQERRDNLHQAVRFGLPDDVQDLVCDGWTAINSALARHVGKHMRGEISTDELEAARELEDYRYQEKLRRRVDATVDDPDLREKLKAWYRFNCKRPTFNDDYLETFNRDNVTLIDVSDDKGVERITEKGLIAAGREIEVDCIIYASGFEVTSSIRRRLGIETIKGRDGRSLYDYWKDGFRTFYGYMADGFPNQFFTGYTQGAVAANLTLMLDHQTTHIAHIIGETIRRGARTVEATPEAVEYWQDEMREHRASNDAFFAECTPGYYNNEGGAVRRSYVGEVYAPGVAAFNALLKAWRDRGDLGGLALDGVAAPAPVRPAKAETKASSDAHIPAP
jgi:cyclohexanone monooxygenase